MWFRRISVHKAFFSIFQEDILYFKSMNWRKTVVMSFLILQLLLIIRARFVPERWFCWAPHDTQVEYELTVFVNGRELGKDEIFARYHRSQQDRDPRSPENVKDIIRQQGLTYGKNEDIRVVMHYSVNGKAQEPWIWVNRP